MELNVTDILKEMVAFDTTNLTENKCLIKDYVGKLLDEHQITYELIEHSSERCSLVAAIGKNTGKEPIIFTSNLGTKFLIATSLMTFITLSKETLNREVIFVLTSDKEEGNGRDLQEVIKRYGNKFRRGYVINEGGGFFTENCGQNYYVVTVGEKGRCDVKVTLDQIASLETNRSNNKFLKVLERLKTYNPTRELNMVYGIFMSYLEGGIENDFLRRVETHNSQDKIIIPKYTVSELANGVLKKNHFNFSIEVLPSKTIEDVNILLRELFEGIDVSYEITHFSRGFQSDCTNEFFDRLETVVNRYFCKGAKLLPIYALKRTVGGIFNLLPINIYGASFVSEKMPFESVMNLINHHDEKIDDDTLNLGVKAYLDLCRQEVQDTNPNILNTDTLNEDAFNTSVAAYLKQLVEEDDEEEEEEEERSTLSLSVKAYLGQLDDIEADESAFIYNEDEEEESGIGTLDSTVKAYLRQFQQDESYTKKKVQTITSTDTDTLSSSAQAYLNQLRQDTSKQVKERNTIQFL